jgi:hypothetical protein
MPAQTLANRRVAIFEDDQRNRERLSGLVNLCGGVAVPVDPPAPSLNRLLAYFTKQRINLVICDHHLSQRGDYAPYFGAQAVAESYGHGVGGILVTAYERDDAELSLRRFRRRIPALIRSPDDLSRVKLQTALLQAENEVQQHQLTRERVPHRTIMTVLRVDDRGASKIVKVMMSQWDSEQEVGFPLDLIPAKLRMAAKPGSLLIAQVNIDAARQEDLFFDEFELPNPDALKKAKSILGRP